MSYSWFCNGCSEVELRGPFFTLHPFQYLTKNLLAPLAFTSHNPKITSAV